MSEPKLTREVFEQVWGSQHGRLTVGFAFMAGKQWALGLEEIAKHVNAIVSLADIFHVPPDVLLYSMMDAVEEHKKKAADQQKQEQGK